MCYLIAILALAATAAHADQCATVTIPEPPAWATLLDREPASQQLVAWQQASWQPAPGTKSLEARHDGERIYIRSKPAAKFDTVVIE